MANRTVTIKSADGDYSSLNAAFAGEVVDNADLVTNEMILTFECYNFADTTIAATGTGWTTSASYYLNIVAVDSHGGKYSTNAYRLETATTTQLIRIEENYTRFTGIQFKATGTASTYNQNGITSAATVGVVLDQCIGVYAGSGNTSYVGLAPTGSSSATGCFARNCIAIGWRDNFVLDGTANEIDVENCTAINATRYGVRSGSWRRVRCRNTIAVGSGTADIFECSLGSSNNITSDATGSITNCIVKSETDDDLDADVLTKGTDKWVIFVDPANDDYALASFVHVDVEQNEAIDAGADLSARFEHDIINTVRPQGDEFDIGPFEFFEEGATATGSATISLSSTGSGSRVVTGSGAASISLTGSGTSGRVITATGDTTLDVLGVGSGTYATPGVTASGAATIGASASGSGTRETGASGAASVSLSSVGAAIRALVASGAASISVSSSGNAATEAKSAMGSATVAISSSGSASRRLGAWGASGITLTPSGNGSIRGVISALGQATVALSVAGVATRSLSCVGAATVALTSEGADKSTLTIEQRLQNIEGLVEMIFARVYS